MEMLRFLLCVIGFVTYTVGLSLLRNVGKKEWAYGTVASLGIVILAIGLFVF